MRLSVVRARVFRYWGAEECGKLADPTMVLVIPDDQISHAILVWLVSLTCKPDGHLLNN